MILIEFQIFSYHFTVLDLTICTDERCFHNEYYTLEEIYMYLFHAEISWVNTYEWYSCSILLDMYLTISTNWNTSLKKMLKIRQIDVHNSRWRLTTFASRLQKKIVMDEKEISKKILSYWIYRLYSPCCTTSINYVLLWSDLINCLYIQTFHSIGHLILGWCFLRISLLLAKTTQMHLKLCISNFAFETLFFKLLGNLFGSNMLEST